MAIVQFTGGGKDHAAMVNGVKARANRKLKSDEQGLIEIGVPTKPHSHWECGTDLVWPVVRVLKPADFILYESVYVCRHQIVAGD